MTQFINIGDRDIKLARNIMDFILADENYKVIIKLGKEYKIGPHISYPPKDRICIGRNYPANIEEAGIEIPEFPWWFLKARSSIIGPLESIMLPDVATNVNQGIELAVVIG